MRQANLFRLRRSDQGTEGLLVSEDFHCRTLELPWRNNNRRVSCIPQGEYRVEIRYSNKYGRIYWVRRVPNRTYILLHSGNFGGDKSKNYKTHTMGCILLGKRSGFLGGQVAVLNSRITVRSFMEELDYQPFNFRIQETF